MIKRMIRTLIGTMLFSVCLMIPAQAFAAPTTTLTIDDVDYTAATSGAGWQWDGGNNLTLNGFHGEHILSDGDLIISVNGDNALAVPGGSSTGTSISGIFSPMSLT